MYWPKEGLETHGFIQVKLIKETVLSTYTIRTFTLKNLKVRKVSRAPRSCLLELYTRIDVFFFSIQKHQCERMVYQYHYVAWPDHGIPADSLPVLSFVRKSAAANPDDAGPIIVHCR